MNVEVLNEFFTLSVTGSFSVAAERLNMSQPSLSRHIRELEKEMGAALVERSTPVMLTAAGRTVLNMASGVLASVESAKRAIARADSDSGRPVFIQNVLYCPCFTDLLYNYGSERRAACAPELEVRGVPACRTAYDGLFSGDLDIAFTSGVGTEAEGVEKPLLPEGLVAVPLPCSVSEVVFLVRRDSVYADLHAPRLADLSQLPVMMPTSQEFDYEMCAVRRLFEMGGAGVPRFDMRQVGSLSDFFSLDPERSAFFTTKSLTTRFQQFSSWVMDNTVPLEPEGGFVRQVFLVHKANPTASVAAAVGLIGEIWARKGYYGR